MTILVQNSKKVYTMGLFCHREERIRSNLSSIPYLTNWKFRICMYVHKVMDLMQKLKITVNDYALISKLVSNLLIPIVTEFT